MPDGMGGVPSIIDPFNAATRAALGAGPGEGGALGRGSVRLHGGADAPLGRSSVRAGGADAPLGRSSTRAGGAADAGGGGLARSSVRGATAGGGALGRSSVRLGRQAGE